MNKSFMFFVFILFIFAVSLFSSSPLYAFDAYPANEVTIQTQGAYSSQTTSFELIPLTALLSRDGNLNYYLENTPTQFSSLTGNVRCAHDGYQLRNYGEGDHTEVGGCGSPTAGLKPMRYGFYKIIIKVNNIYKKHFYYDVREANYPSYCTSNDITVRYDVGANTVYVANRGTDENIYVSPGMWITIATGDILLLSEFQGCTERNYSPFWETNGLAVFSEKGTENITVPNLYWGPYYGFTPENYKIYWSRVPAGNQPGNFQFLAQVDGQTTSYLHEGIETGPGWTAYYKVKAFASIQESNYTNIGEVNVTNVLFKNSESVDHQDITLNDKYFNLEQNFPNPFNPITEILFNLPSDQSVQLDVYNVKGALISRLVKSYLQEGNHKFLFNGSALPSGVYFYRLVTSSHTITKRMLLIK